MKIKDLLHRKVFHRISTKFILYIISFMLFSTAVISCIFYFGSENIIVKKSEQALEENLTITAASINADINNIARFSDTLENLIVTSIDLEQVTNNDTKMEQYESTLRPIIKNEIQEKGMKSGWVIFDPRTMGGNHLISFYEKDGKLEEVPQYDIAAAGVYADEWWKGAYDNGAVWTAPYYWQKWDKQIISYSRKIEKGGKVLGVAGSDLYFDDLRDRIKSLRIYDTGYYILFDQNFNVLYHPDAAVKNLRGNKALSYVVDQIAANPTGVGTVQYTYNGIKKIMAYHKLDNGWYIAAAPPLNEMLSDLYTIRNYVIVVSLTLFAICLVAAHLFGRVITSRMTKIRNATMELSQGNLGVTLDISSKDELGQLAGVFTTMAENIRKAQEKLSQNNLLLEETNDELYRTSVLLQEEKETLDITLRSIGDGIIATDSAGMVKMINNVAEILTGWRTDEAQGRPLTEIFDIFDETSHKKSKNPVELVLKTDRIVELANHTALRAKDGTVRSISDCAAPIKSREGKTVGVVLVFRDVTQEKRNQEAISHLSNHDILTGVYNRVYAERELEMLEANGTCPVSIIMGDVNGLKITNDVFGHEEGDNLLITIGNIVKQALRPGDILSRWGGDEFVIIMPGTDNKEATQVCERIYRLCEEQKHTSGNTITSISIGCATKETADRSLRSVLKSAEDSMYKRKLLESRSTHSSIIASMKKTLYEKSHETEAHTSRLRDLCMMIALQLNLSENEKNDLELFAVLHDIGKITIDDRILNKTGPLNEEEWFEMKKHPETGCRIALSAVELAHISEYILTHHEHWDGGGYPQGLKGKQIPLLSRILAVVDAYDAMTQDRVYRKAMPVESAIAELKSAAGSQFDPGIVEIFLRIMENRQEDH